MKRLLRFVAGLFAFAIVAFGVAGFVWWKWATGPKSTNKNAPVVRVKVEPGTSVLTVGQYLEVKGVLRSAQALVFLGQDKTIKPGVYDLSPADNPRTLLRHLVKGDVATNRVTFPEGFTVRQIALRLKKNELIQDENAFLDLVTTKGNTLKADFPLPENLEGYLFPDTYKFPVGATDAEIAQRMVDDFAKLVVEDRAQELKDSGRSLADIVNIASMIEREAETQEDRPRIAGVIYNRLKIGMKLQLDATIQYARIQAGEEHANRLLYKDLEVISPYNTYKVAGLPPGPICNPGLACIDAALKPEASHYLYYVAGTGKGHIFAQTYAEHQANIARVRRETRQSR
jgi:UPF0755 protein